MRTIISDSKGNSAKVRLNKIFLTSGFLSAVFYIITDILASSLYGGYSIIDQNYSELLATGAPTRPAMLVASVVYNLLVFAFALGVWNSAARGITSKITGVMMAVYAVLSMITPSIFQMDMRGAEITPMGSLHPVMTAVMSLFILLSMGFGAFLLSKRFRLYSFITIILLLVFGFITGMQAPKLTAGQATSYMGLTERINIYATMIWFAILSIALLQNNKMNQITDH
jgi:hypothetical protein